jgi:hypothetical protein
MSFVVQDSTGTVVGANAYLTVAKFKLYCDSRGFSYAGYSDPVIETKIVQATDFVDRRFTYIGRKLNGRDQVTQWPRVNARDRDGYYINGIPVEVENATAEYTQRALLGALSPDPLWDASGATVQSKSEKVGPIEESVTYVSGASIKFPRYPIADSMLTAIG